MGHLQKLIAGFFAKEANRALFTLPVAEKSMLKSVFLTGPS